MPRKLESSTSAADLAASSGSHSDLHYEPIVKQLKGRWPEHRAVIAAAPPGIVLIGSADGSWLLSTCGPGLDPLRIEERIEGFMTKLLFVITGTPGLYPYQADAALRMAYNTLSGPCGMTLLGPRPEGAAVSYIEYRALRRMVGAALRALRSHLPTHASPDEIEAGELQLPDKAALDLLARYNPLGYSPLVLEHQLRVHAAEVGGGYLLLPGSAVCLHVGGSDSRISLLLEHMHADILQPGPDYDYSLRQPIVFTSLQAMATYCAGEKSGQSAKWRRITE